LQRQDHVYKTTDELFCFHNKKFDEMRCKLDSTKNPRSGVWVWRLVSKVNKPLGEFGSEFVNMISDKYSE